MLNKIYQGLHSNVTQWCTGLCQLKEQKSKCKLRLLTMHLRRRMDVSLGISSVHLKQGAAEGTFPPRTSGQDVSRCPQDSRTRRAPHLSQVRAPQRHLPHQDPSSTRSPAHPSALSAEVEGAASSSSILQGTGAAGRERRHSAGGGARPGAVVGYPCPATAASPQRFGESDKVGG